MTGRAYMVEVLIQEMNELFNKQVNAQKESLKNYRSSRRLPQAHGKLCDENESRIRRKKRWAPKKFLIEGKSL